MFDAAVWPVDEVIFREIDGEAILLNPVDGRYYGLDEVGTRIWCCLMSTGRLELAYSELLREFEVSEERLRDDLLVFIAELETHGLIEVERAQTP